MQDTGTISLYRSVLRGWMRVLAGVQGRDVWRGCGAGRLAGMGVGVLDSTGKDRGFGMGILDGTSGGEVGAGRLNSAWRPEQGAGGQGAEGLSGREASYSGRAASVPSKYL